MKGITSSGFKYEVNDNIKKDWRFVKAVAMADSDDESDKIKGYTDIVTLLLGKKGEKALEEHLMTEEGIVPLAAMNQEVIEMIRALKGDADVKK